VWFKNAINCSCSFISHSIGLQAKCPIPKFGYGASLLDFEVAQWQFPTIELQQ